MPDVLDLTTSGIGVLAREQLPILVTIGEAFVEEFRGWRRGFDTDHFLENWRTLYDQDRGVVLAWVEEGRLVGVIGGVFLQDFYDAEPVVADMGWFTDPAHRRSLKGLELLRRLEAWAVERGARRLTFAKLLTPGQGVRVPSYASLGFYPREVTYGKRLGD